MNASEQAVTVARNILGGGEAFTPVPFFWTDQYAVKLQFAGMRPPDALPSVVEGDSHEDSFVIAWHLDGQLTGVLGWNAARAMMPYRRELNAWSRHRTVERSGY